MKKRTINYNRRILAVLLTIALLCSLISSMWLEKAEYLGNEVLYISTTSFSETNTGALGSAKEYQMSGTDFLAGSFHVLFTGSGSYAGNGISFDINRKSDTEIAAVVRKITGEQEEMTESIMADFTADGTVETELYCWLDYLPDTDELQAFLSVTNERPKTPQAVYQGLGVNAHIGRSCYIGFSAKNPQDANEHGTYVLKEFDAPGGYLKVDNQTISVTTESDVDADSFTKLEATLNGSPISANLNTGYIEMTIEDPAEGSADLPATGGMGRTIVYVIGALTLIGACTVLVITRSRKRTA